MGIFWRAIILSTTFGIIFFIALYPVSVDAASFFILFQNVYISSTVTFSQALCVFAHFNNYALTAVVGWKDTVSYGDKLVQVNFSPSFIFQDFIKQNHLHYVLNGAKWRPVDCFLTAFEVRVDTEHSHSASYP